ncbi:MAG TPA: peptide MFS transporter [Thermoanaerobaculia bacterium]|nr:peptide MFS transporter [Thermoanaerobaculia bacterium]
MAKDPTSEFSSPSSTVVAGGIHPSTAAAAADTSFFGHPRGLATLFFTEFWERFSYYGMRALLFLFMAGAVTTANPGLGMTETRAGAIYGLYTAFVYLLALPGGWVADQILGQRRAVFLGGCIIAAGHFSMAVPSAPTFYAGLVMIVLGTGLLKPNISTMVGELYPEGGARRDAGFSIFYMGINLGAFVAPLVCGYLGERIGWHMGFGAAGVGMLFGLVQYAFGGKYLGEAGLHPNASGDSGVRGRNLRNLFIGLAAAAVFALLWISGVIPLTVEWLANGTGVIILLLAFGYLSYQLTAGGLDPIEKKRMIVIFVLFLFSALFWSGFEQAGSSLNLFADRLTDRNIGGWEMPTSWLQSVNPILIIALAPVFAWLWVALSRRKVEPSSPAKFSWGLIFLGLGFGVMVWASILTNDQTRQVGPIWLCLTYLFHTCGELCLSPVGLSTVTKLAPHRKVGQMMGIWFMSIALGNLIAGLVAGQFEKLPLPQLFGAVFAITAGAGLILALLARPIRKLMSGVH